ncbi:hypothetical protein GOB85_12180 [Acetobacter sp. LMG 1636]|uniref:Uncharacterized protein n=1 Tax=Acetobacter fallax TaxID=1737473 RepID=A0ABX0KFP4_9PROT|nr:hypothetical protein [Acetobacter fallax]NHO33240.1 hypothetical protein [Acetobacter fallax]NHO36860.1 hypothetical protein [Acetobacter fallax]
MSIWKTVVTERLVTSGFALVGGINPSDAGLFSMNSGAGHDAPHGAAADRVISVLEVFGA